MYGSRVVAQKTIGPYYVVITGELYHNYDLSFSHYYEIIEMMRQLTRNNEMIRRNYEVLITR